jgi:hypothetical protein
MERPSETTVQKIDRYCEAIENVRKEELKYYQNHRNLEQEENYQKNDSEIYTNILLLYYIEQRYALLKKALILMSDSKKHFWLNIKKSARDNSYESYTTDLVDNGNNLTEIFEELLKNINIDTLIKLTKKYQNEAIWLERLCASAVILGAALCLTLMLYGAFINSFPLILSGLVAPAIVIHIVLLISLINHFTKGALFNKSCTVLFKKKVANEFAALEAGLKQEFDENSIFSKGDFKCTLDLPESCKTSSTKLEISFKQQEQKLTRGNFLSIFKGESPSNGTKSLKESVNEEYTKLLTRASY